MNQEDYIRVLSDTGHYLDKPSMSKRDARKVGAYWDKAHKAVFNAQLGGNMRYIQEVLNMIEKVSKLSDKALDDSHLKGSTLDHLWACYAAIETQGRDNAHYVESDIPCDDRSKGWEYYQPTKRRTSDFGGYLNWLEKIKG